MMRRYLEIVVTGWLLLAAAAVFAQVEVQPTQRLALVVGNGAYGQTPIEHAQGDAEALGARLQALGFEVLLHRDLNLDQLRTALDQFTGRLAEGTVGLFFYVGHGLQIEGDNYLVPVDAKAGYASDIAEQCLPLSATLDQLADSGARNVVALIDAARPHPLRSRSLKKARGLAPMAPPAGVTLMLADAPDSPHRFGPEPMDAAEESPQGLFTRVLLETLTVPHLTLSQLLRQVQAMVGEATLEQRRPWIAGPLTAVSVQNDPPGRFGRLLPESSVADAVAYIADDPALAPLPPKPELPPLPTAEEGAVEGEVTAAPEPAQVDDQDTGTATMAEDLPGQDPHAFALNYDLKLFERLVLDLERIALLETAQPSPATHETVQRHLQAHYPDLCAAETTCDPAAMVTAALIEAPQRPPEPPPQESEDEPVLGQEAPSAAEGQTETAIETTADGDEGQSLDPQPPVLSPPLDETQRADLLWDFEVVLLDGERQRLLARAKLSPLVKAAGKAALDERYAPAFDPEKRMIDLIEQVDPENREALIIGNGALGPTAAADLCNALEAQDFNVVQHQGIDGDNLRREIEAFTAQLHGMGVGFFYFGGDAFAHQGENYLLPEGIRVDDETAFVVRAVPLSLLLTGLEAAQNVFNVVVIDAPFKPAFPEGVDLPEAGLAEVTPPANTLVLFSHPPDVARIGADKARSVPVAVVEADEEVGGTIVVDTEETVRALMMADKLAPLLYRPGLELGPLLDQLETRMATVTHPPQQVWWRGGMRPLTFNDTLRRFDILLTRLDCWRRADEVDPTGQWPEMLWPLVAGDRLTGSEAVASGDMQGLIMTALKTDHTLKLDQLAWERGYTPSYSNEHGMRFTYVPEGEFVMGSRPDESKREKDETAFNATLTEGFYMMRTEVTQGEWSNVMAANPSVFDDCGLDCPVEMVSWEDAQGLINALNGVVVADKTAEDEATDAAEPSAPEGDPTEESIPPAMDGETVDQSPATESDGEPITEEEELAAAANEAAAEVVTAILEARALTPAELEPVEKERTMSYQFPTEAQWEYACRAGEHELFGYGHDLWKLPSYAWYKENARSSTHAVAVLKPNSWGFYDMHGNVWEWCQDNKWDYPLNEATNPAGRRADRLKIVRGGSWYYDAMSARCANRYYYLPAQANYNIGLRLVATPK